MRNSVYTIVRQSEGGGAIMVEPVAFLEKESAYERLNKIRHEYMVSEGWTCEDAPLGFIATYREEGKQTVELKFSLLELELCNKYRATVELDVNVSAEDRQSVPLVATQAIKSLFRNRVKPVSVDKLEVKEVKEVKICT